MMLHYPVKNQPPAFIGKVVLVDQEGKTQLFWNNQLGKILLEYQEKI